MRFLYSSTGASSGLKQPSKNRLRLHQFDHILDRRAHKGNTFPSCLNKRKEGSISGKKGRSFAPSEMNHLQTPAGLGRRLHVAWIKWWASHPSALSTHQTKWAEKTPPPGAHAISRGGILWKPLFFRFMAFGFGSPESTAPPVIAKLPILSKRPASISSMISGPAPPRAIAEYMLSHQVEALELLERHSAFIAQTSRRFASLSECCRFITEELTLPQAAIQVHPPATQVPLPAEPLF